MPTRKQSSTKNNLEKSEKMDSTEISEDTTQIAQENWVTIKSDLQEIKENLEKTVKTSDLKDLVTCIVIGLLEDFQKESEKREWLFKQQIDNLTKEVDRLTLDNESLREKICEGNKSSRELQKEVTNLRNIATSAALKSNYSEQYSRKSNIKIYGVQEKKNRKCVGSRQNHAEGKRGCRYPKGRHFSNQPHSGLKTKLTKTHYNENGKQRQKSSSHA